MSKKIRKILLLTVFVVVATVLLGLLTYAQTDSAMPTEYNAEQGGEQEPVRDLVGDLNRDGIKDENDAIHLLNNSIFGGEFANGAFYIDQPSDYNNDGVVDEKDAIFLLYNVLNMENYHICDYPDRWDVVEVVEPTCNAEGYTLVKCACGKEEQLLRTPKTNTHAFDRENPDKTNQATCLENGYIVYTCTVCGATEIEQQSATGKHDYRGGTCETDAICTICSTTLPASGHDYPTTPTEVIAATCKGGSEIYKCNNCDSTYTKELAPVDHRFAENAWQTSGLVETDKACTFIYVESAVCLDCGETIEQNSSETVVKHTESTSLTEPTCVTPGEKTVKCSVCEETLSETEIPIPTNKAEKVHKWDDGVKVGNVTTYTCQNGCNETKTTVEATEDGKVEIGAAEEVVLNSGAAIVPDDNIKEEFGSKDVSVKVEVVDTSKDLGLSEENKKKLEELGDVNIYDFNMTVDGQSITDFGEKDGAKFEMTVRIPYQLVEGDDPDCILIWYIDENGDVTNFEAKYVDGYAVFTTTHFSYYTVVRMTPAERCAYYGSHNYQTTTVPATCVTGGYTLQVCTRCDERTITNEVAALGHQWQTTVTAPTCTTVGTTVEKCLACSITYTTTEKAIGHNPVESVDEYKLPTCTAKGERVFRCTNDNCTYFYKEEIAQLKHEYATTTLDPTCLEDGAIITACTTCKDQTTVTILALGHDYTSGSLCTRCQTECAHDYQYGVCTICSAIKEKPVVPEVCKHENVEITYEFVDANRRYCADGVIIIETCTKCGNVNESITYKCEEQLYSVDLSGYKHCGKHNFDYYACPCGNKFRLANGEFIDAQFDIELDDCVGYGCRDCGMKAIAVINENKDDCENSMIVGIALYFGDELIHTINYLESYGYHDIVTSYEFVNPNLPYCEYGVKITEYCTKCKYESSYTTKQCEPINIVNVDLSGYNHCGKHNFSYRICPCGLEWDFYNDPCLDKEFEVEAGEYDMAVGYACDVEGCPMYVIAGLKTYAEGCVIKNVVTYNFYCGETLVHTMVFNGEPELNHNIVYSYEFANKNISICEAGVFITESCTGCDYTNTYYTTECVTWLVEVDLSKYDHCGKHNFNYYTCPCGYSVEFVDEDMINLDNETELELDGENAYGAILSCKDCAMKAIQNVTYAEGECTAERTLSVQFFFGDEFIHELGYDIKYVEHSYSEDMEITFFNGENCENGFVVRSTCSRCGEKFEYNLYYHIEIVEERINLSEYGGCDEHSITIYGCPCGYEQSIYVNGMIIMDTPIYVPMPEGGMAGGNVTIAPPAGGVIIGGNNVTYYCNKCNVQVKKTTTEGERNENCEYTVYETYQIIVGDEVKNTLSATRTVTGHTTYVVSIEMMGATCDDGIRTTYSCMYCGYTYMSTNYGHEYYTQYIGSEYGVCESHQLSVDICNRCGDCRNLWGRDFQYTTTETGWLFYCNKCSVQVYETETFGEADGCYQESTYISELYVDGKLLYIARDTYYNSNHDVEISYEFRDPALGCAGGVIKYETCKKCGEVWEYGSEGHMLIDAVLDLTQYGACDYHSVWGAMCEFCKAIEYIYINDFNYQKIENGELYFCKDCGISIEVFSTYGEKGENCSISISTIYIVYKDGEEVKRLESLGTEYMHNYTESYEFLGKDCLDGVIIHYGCKDCGEDLGYNKVYSHSYINESIEITGYDVCKEHYIEQRVCTVCDLRTHISLKGGKISSTGDTVSGITNTCRSCGLTMITNIEYGEKDENCQIKLTFCYTVTFKGEVIYEAEGPGYQDAHEYDIVYIPNGSTCDDGYYCIVNCTVCGFHDEYEDSGHIMQWDYLDLYEQGMCGDHCIETYLCEVCGFGEFYVYGGNLTEKGSGSMSLYTCDLCNLYVQITRKTGADLGNCTSEVYTIIIVNLKGERAYEGTASGIETKHDWQTSYELINPEIGCDGGVRVIESCKLCGESDERTVWNHEYEETQLDLSDYKICSDHVVNVRQCVFCGTCNSIRLEGEFVYYNSWEGENGEITHGRQFCENCNIIVWKYFSYGEPDGNCMADHYTDYQLYIDDQLIISGSSYGRAEMHQWREYYEFVDPELGCEGGARCIRTCSVCGRTNDYAIKGHRQEETIIDLSEYGACSEHFIRAYQCIICQSYTNMYIDGGKISYEYRELDGGLVAIETRSCETCNLSFVISTHLGDYIDACKVKVNVYYTLYVNDVVVLEKAGNTFAERHDMISTYTLINPELGCEGGVEWLDTCTRCGEFYGGQYSYHQHVIETTYDLADYGHACGTGSITVSSCYCTYKVSVNIDWNGFNQTSKRETIDGVTYTYYTYTCDSCGYVFTRDIFTTRDEFCNATSHNVYTFGGKTVSYQQSKGQSHSPEEKLVPEESYEYKNDLGGITYVNAYETYCRYCHASIEKRVDTAVYNADGECISESYDYYQYVALGEDVSQTVAILNNKMYIEYFYVTTLDGKERVRCVAYELNTYYDANGKESSWERRDFVYADGNYCVCEIIYTDSNGNRNVEGTNESHPDTYKKLVLGENSKSCEDGLTLVHTCKLCGAETKRYDGWSYGHMVSGDFIDPIDVIDLRDRGAVCEGSIYVCVCPCGKRYGVTVDSKCDLERRIIWRYDENKVEHRYEIYACAVSECGFKFVIDRYYGFDDSCNEVEYYTYYFNVNETNDAYTSTYSFSYKTGSKRHAEMVTSKCVDALVYREWSSCARCGLTESEIIIENGIYTETYNNYNEDGVLVSRNIEQYVAIDNNRHAYTLLRRDETYDELGNCTWWSQNEYVYPNAASGNYCTAVRTFSNSNGTSEVHEEDSHVWSFYMQHCTPAMQVLRCTKCSVTKNDIAHHYGHDFNYDSEKGCYVCWRCGLESQTDGNGSVGFEDRTTELGNGEKYVIGWYNNYGNEYSWELALIEKESGKMFELKLTLEVLDEYLLALDANAVKSIANGYGLSDCGYMVMITFVPTDKNELDYSITLDPHAYVMIEYKAPAGGCESKDEHVWNYKCSLCGDSYVETDFGHDITYSSSERVIRHDDGTVEYEQISRQTCSRCTAINNSISYREIRIYAPNGKMISCTSFNGDSVSTTLTYEYDYTAGTYTNKRIDGDSTCIEVHDLFSNKILSRQETNASGDVSETIWDYDAGIVTRISSDAWVIESRSIQNIYTNEWISEYHSYADGSSDEWRYIYIDGNMHTEYQKAVSSTGDIFENEYDYANDIRVETYTDANGNVTVTKYRISSGESI